MPGHAATRCAVTVAAARCGTIMGRDNIYTSGASMTHVLILYLHVTWESSSSKRPVFWPPLEAGSSSPRRAKWPRCCRPAGSWRPRRRRSGRAGGWPAAYLISYHIISCYVIVCHNMLSIVYYGTAGGPVAASRPPAAVALPARRVGGRSDRPRRRGCSRQCPDLQ